MLPRALSVRFGADMAAGRSDCREYAPQDWRSLIHFFRKPTSVRREAGGPILARLMASAPSVAPPPAAWNDQLLRNPHAVADKQRRVQKMFAAIAPSYD